MEEIRCKPRLLSQTRVHKFGIGIKIVDKNSLEFDLGD